MIKDYSFINGSWCITKHEIEFYSLCLAVSHAMSVPFITSEFISG